MLWEIFVIMVLFFLAFLSTVVVQGVWDKNNNIYPMSFIGNIETTFYFISLFVLVTGLLGSLDGTHLIQSALFADFSDMEKFEISKIRVGECSSTLVLFFFFFFFFFD